MNFKWKIPINKWIETLYQQMKREANSVVNGKYYYTCFSLLISLRYDIDNGQCTHIKYFACTHAEKERMKDFIFTIHTNTCTSRIHAHTYTQFTRDERHWTWITNEQTSKWTNERASKRIVRTTAECIHWVQHTHTHEHVHIHAFGSSNEAYSEGYTTTRARVCKR